MSENADQIRRDIERFTHEAVGRYPDPNEVAVVTRQFDATVQYMAQRARTRRLARLLADGNLDGLYLMHGDELGVEEIESAALSSAHDPQRSSDRYEGYIEPLVVWMRYVDANASHYSRPPAI